LAKKEEASPADLDGLDFIGFDEGLTIRREVDKFLRAQGVAVRLVMYFDNIQMIKEAVALGSGVSILPARTMLAEIAQGRLVAVPFRTPGLLRPVGVLHGRRRKFNSATQAFLELLLAPCKPPGSGQESARLVNTSA
jgi:DNA-binding transcriptional LysR family regulator